MVERDWSWWFVAGGGGTGQSPGFPASRERCCARRDANLAGGPPRRRDAAGCSSRITAACRAHPAREPSRSVQLSVWPCARGCHRRAGAACPLSARCLPGDSPPENSEVPTPRDGRQTSPGLSRHPILILILSLSSAKHPRVSRSFNPSHSTRHHPLPAAAPPRARYPSPTPVPPVPPCGLSRLCLLRARRSTRRTCYLPPSPP